MADAPVMMNTARWFWQRYNEAHALYNTERHDECILMLEAMTHDSTLPLFFVLQVHYLLASGVHTVRAGREHLRCAEEAYAELMERAPPGVPGEERADAHLVKIRKGLDEIKVELDEDELAYPQEEEADLGGESLGEDAESEIADGQDIEDLTLAIDADMGQDQEQEHSQEQELSQGSSVAPQQPDSQTTIGSPQADRPILTPVTPRTRMAFSPGGSQIPFRTTPSSRPRYPASGAVPSAKRDFEGGEDDEDVVPESPSKKGRR